MLAVNVFVHSTAARVASHVLLKPGYAARRSIAREHFYICMFFPAKPQYGGTRLRSHGNLAM